MAHILNIPLKDKLRTAYEAFHRDMETIIARYDVLQDRSDEELLMDLSHAIDQFKITVEILKGDVQEGLI